MIAGHLEGEQLARAVASADILLHTSTTETFGNVVLESMASGLAVVCAATASAEALIEDGRTGLLCPPDDIESYRQAIRGLVENPNERRQLGAAARQASEAFSWSNACQSAAEAYREVLHRPA